MAAGLAGMQGMAKAQSVVPDENIDPNSPMAPKTIIPTEDGPALVAPATPKPGNNAKGNTKEAEKAPEPKSAFPQLAEELNSNKDLMVVNNVPLNEVFQYLASKAKLQYFFNNRINGPEFNVTGHIKQANPLEQMRALASFYSLELFEKDGTVYALDKAQVAQMPATEWHYQLRYLRPRDITQIKELITPLLTAGTGRVNFEPKTNTLVVIDSARRIQDVERLVRTIDREKGQISLETKILRTNSEAGKSVGVDWSRSLGRNSGVNIGVFDNLNALFNLDPVNAAGEPIESILDSGNATNNGGLVLSPIQVSGVLKALKDNNLVKQESSPTLITEDNEQAIIAVIDRIPIITSTVNNGTGGTTTTEQVRYTIDEDDPTLSDKDAAGRTREIGVTVTVLPNILPDGSIRMQLRPRAGQVTGYETSGTEGSVNRYPRVRESSIETIARVPSGCTLLLGGFYEEINTVRGSEVPVLGKIPVINFFFKNTENVKEKTSLVFALTPRVYNPVSCAAINRINADTDHLLRNKFGQQAMVPGKGSARSGSCNPAYDNYELDVSEPTVTPPASERYTAPSARYRRANSRQ